MVALSHKSAAARFPVGRAVRGVPGMRRQRGATLVEFAFIFMVFMTMVLGIIEFSRALYAYHFVSNVARDATRWAAVNGFNCTNDSSCNGTAGMNNGPASTTDITNYVVNHVTMGINPNGITVVPSWPIQAGTPAYCNPTSTYYDHYNDPGCTVQVQVSYQFHFIFPFVHNSPITLSSTSQMVIVH